MGRAQREPIDCAESKVEPPDAKSKSKNFFRKIAAVLTQIKSGCSAFSNTSRLPPLLLETSRISFTNSLWGSRQMGSRKTKTDYTILVVQFHDGFRCALPILRIP